MIQYVDATVVDAYHIGAISLLYNVGLIVGDP